MPSRGTGGVYNAADDLLSRNLEAGRGDKTAYIDAAGSYTYAELNERANRAANALAACGIGIEQRVVMCAADTIDFPVCFLGAIKAGMVPVPINTRLSASDYDYILEDSRAAALIVSEPLLELFAPHLDSHQHLQKVIVSGSDGHGHDLLSELTATAGTEFEPAATRANDMCIWLYTSGTTGTPKGSVHIHSSLIQTADLYAGPTLGITRNDIVYSAAKLFFAYGLGNALTFPMSVGATTVLPDVYWRVLTTGYGKSRVPWTYTHVHGYSPRRPHNCYNAFVCRLRANRDKRIIANPVRRSEE